MNRLRLKKSIILILILVLTEGVTVARSAISEHQSVFQNREPEALPDGRKGQLSLYGTTLYTSETSNGTRPEIDAQTFTLAADFITGPYLTARSRFELRDRHSRRYQWTAGLRLYWYNPNIHRNHVNPDGPVGRPVFDIEGGLRFSDNPDARGLTIGKIAVNIPVSSRLTGGVGYWSYEQKDSLDVVSFCGMVNLFFADYASGSEWDNPDGPSGNLVVRLLGGGSSRGFRAEVKFLVPLKPTLTLLTYLNHVHIDDGDYRAYSAGIGLAWYPSR